MKFPQYRKLEGFGRFYKITGDKHFTETYLLNGEMVLNEVNATQYPEMLRIQDMLSMQWNYREMSEEEIKNYFGWHDSFLEGG